MDRSGPVVLVWITHFKVSRPATFLVTCLNFSGRFRSPNANVERSHAEMRNQLVVRCRRPSSRGRPKATPSLLLDGPWPAATVYKQRPLLLLLLQFDHTVHTCRCGPFVCSGRNTSYLLSAAGQGRAGQVRTLIVAFQQRTRERDAAAPVFSSS